MSQFIEVHRNNFTISTDSTRLDLDCIADMLSRSYWAKGRPRDRLERAIEHSLVFGLYDKGQQIGVARVISDYSIFAYLCDVFIHEEYRGRGLGKWLIESILDHPDLQGVRRWVLATADAHNLYRKNGFEVLSDPADWMQLVRPFPGEIHN
jgi:GNAT superfamily N-acetyltransferase